MLAEKFLNDNLSTVIVSRDEFRPYPTASSRQAWEGLDDELKAALVRSGDHALAYSWEPLPATVFMEFKRNGNRSNYERISFRRRDVLATLVIAECVEGQGRFVDAVVDAIWTICEESFWGVSAHNYSSRFGNASLPDVSEPIIDLFASETAVLLALSAYLLREQLDSVSPLVIDRIDQELQKRIIMPYLTVNSFWWLGLDENGQPNSARSVNNWNPWCNSNVLLTTLLTGKEDQRIATIQKALVSLDRFIAEYHSDGGCDEGTSYWSRAGASLFECLEVLSTATSGWIDLYDQPLIKNMGRYLYRMCIKDDWYVNFADGGAKVGISSELVFRYGKRIGDQRLQSLGAFEHDRTLAEGMPSFSGNLSSIWRRLESIFNFQEMSLYCPVSPYVRDAWLDGIQVMASREVDGSSSGFFVAAKGGHNAESHNHNDVGNFIVFYDGKPVLIDAGVETYTAKTFSAARYEIWTMQSSYHNLPSIGDYQQLPGKEFAADDVTCVIGNDLSYLSLDISHAYPREAGLKQWARTVTLYRQNIAVEVTDEFALDKPAMVTLNLLFATEPYVAESGMLVLKDSNREWLRLAYDPELQPTVEKIEINDARLRPVWGESVYRVVLSSSTPVDTGKHALKIQAV